MHIKTSASIGKCTYYCCLIHPCVSGSPVFMWCLSRWTSLCRSHIWFLFCRSHSVSSSCENTSMYRILLQPPQKCPPFSVTGPRCPPPCCNWEQLCGEVTIVHTEWFLEEGPGCVQSTLYPHAECRQATVPTVRSVHRAASLQMFYFRMPPAQFVSFYCTGGRPLSGAVMWPSALERVGIKT